MGGGSSRPRWRCAADGCDAAEYDSYTRGREDDTIPGGGRDDASALAAVITEIHL